MATRLEPQALSDPLGRTYKDSIGGQEAADATYSAGESPLSGLSGLLRRRWASLLIVTALVIVCIGATAHNIMNNPIRFKDEGVYIAQAWAIPNLHSLAHYTYWYDHPPLGWIQMSLWATLTNGWER